jgi:hypothetical protein
MFHHPKVIFPLFKRICEMPEKLVFFLSPEWNMNRNRPRSSLVLNESLGQNVYWVKFCIGKGIKKKKSKSRTCTLVRQRNLTFLSWLLIQKQSGFHAGQCMMYVRILQLPLISNSTFHMLAPSSSWDERYLTERSHVLSIVKRMALMQFPWHAGVMRRTQQLIKLFL